MRPSGGDVSPFGGYVIAREVGRGGHAVVYLARNGSDRRRVALKVLDEQHRTPLERARLDREFAFAHALDHPNIVTMYERGPYWLAMQFVDGGDSTRLTGLHDRLAALAQIADALDYTHRRGVVHCDVTPSNILVPVDFPRAGAVLVDFGVAHAVVEDVGRPQRNPQVSLQYTAPEVLSGKPPSAATDEYGLACTAVELLTGAPPFAAANAAELVDAQLHRMPPALSREFDWLPRSFDTVLGRAIAKVPEVRYRSCTEFVENLARALDAR